MEVLLKDLFSKDFVSLLSSKIKKYYDVFDFDSFEKEVFNNQWIELELKQRMRHIVVCLNQFLVFKYTEQLDVLIKVKKEIQEDKSIALQSMVFQDFVEVYGLEDFDNSIKALKIFTINSSSEFAIRQFIIKYEDKTMSKLKAWTKSSNEHVRRLSSEGCRPRLPWAIALPLYKNDPSKVLEIIELLKNDKSEYVRKSVANNLNDISKDNPIKVLEFVESNLGKSKNLDWICKHASRTLLKQGNDKTLKLFGYKDTSHIEVTNFSFLQKVKIGEEMFFSFDLKSKTILGNLRVEYAIYYLKSNNTHSKKMFMISQNNINKNDKSFKKKQSFKELTTRKHYRGEHFIALFLNGKEYVKKRFILE